MSSVVIAGDTSGSVTLQAPAVAGTTTLTLPATSGTVLTTSSPQIASPAFSAWISTAPTISNNTVTKIPFNQETFDTNNCYDTGNSRFTPNVAGFYQVLLVITFNAPAINVFSGIITKNGSVQVAAMQVLNAGAQYPSSTTSALIYMNGSTDYLEASIYQNSGSNGVWLPNRTDLNIFQAFFVRAA